MTTAEPATVQSLPAFPITPAETPLTGTHIWLTEKPHPGFAPSVTAGYRRLLAGNLLNAQGNHEFSCDSAEGFTVVNNNPLSLTDPSGMFGEATGIGAAACGPVCAGIGAVIDIGAILGGIFGFGGGPPPTIAPGLATPSSPILGSNEGFGFQEGQGGPPAPSAGVQSVDLLSALRARKKKNLSGGCPAASCHTLDGTFPTYKGPYINVMPFVFAGLGGIYAEEAIAVEEAFHYTANALVPAIGQEGLRAGQYATLSGELSPLQAQLDLALPPNRGLRDAVLRIDLAGLRRAGFKIPQATKVARKFNMPGGGYEIYFPYQIPPKFISVVPK